MRLNDAVAERGKRRQDFSIGVGEGCNPLQVVDGWKLILQMELDLLGGLLANPGNPVKDLDLLLEDSPAESSASS